jgi:kynurenine formamidase
MGRKFVDISVAIENNAPSDPPGYEFSIEYLDHQRNREVLAKRYPGLDVDLLPHKEAFAIEKVRLSTHNGTHVDAPWHYASVMEDGTRAPTIDQMPLEWFFGNGVKLDLRHLPDGYIAKAEDIQKELDRIGYSLKPNDIVLVNTCAGARYGHTDYPNRGFGMGREATLFLTSRGIRVAGTDAWSWDVPHKYAVARFAEDGDITKILEGHKAGTKTAFCHMEKLANLHLLPDHGFQVVCFPVKIHAASGGWTRAVAILEE